MLVKDLLNLINVKYEEVFEGYVISLRDFFLNFSMFKNCDYEVDVKNKKVIIFEI